MPGTLFLLTSIHSNRLRAYKSTLVPKSYEGRQLKHEVLPYKLKDRDFIPGWCHISNLCYLAHTGSGLTQPPGKTFLPPGIKKVARQVSEECRRYECQELYLHSILRCLYIGILLLFVTEII